MIEISHEMIRFDVHFKDIFCCDCFYDEIYFLLRQKRNYEIFEERFSKIENCYFSFVYASMIIACYNTLKFSKNKYNLSSTKCIETILTKDISLCSICTIDLFREINVLNEFRLKW